MDADNCGYYKKHMPLGARVKTLMEEQGLSQAELARRVGLSQPAIFALINRNKTGSKSLHLIARELGTTPAFLNGETDDRGGEGDPASLLTSEELSWVGLLRNLKPRERNAALTLVRAIAPVERIVGT
jgi:transcriptional regulator with XRE-family HTH domain